MTAGLTLAGVSRNFGGLRAVSDMSFETARGEIFGVIGPNGAGKTTLFNVIAGVHPASDGRISFYGKEITGSRSDRVSRLGIARTFQATNVFKEESVSENLRRGALFGEIHSPLAFLRRCFAGRAPAATRPDIDEIAAFIGLADQMGKPAGSLAYGLQKILGVGMALMQRPRLMLMDEPAAGLNPTEKTVMAALIARLRDERGIDVLVVEHDMKLIMSICDRILVVRQGCRIALGTPEAIQADQAVIEAYLGADYEFA
ncbi:ABC transporter ATP-binding protein [Bosea sp. (in: a-proteobacteria)]|jgi:branched-chain amino acid transport system ATP-binding protein|uniref:ABC transporter ATP-binding protein n=1 Tax=Bosea sp. (in: a-proteobacteria) TaxID=1871050 RepID=UPI002DDD0648|nr:ABC transporter ATP-binding protein [Bosea sp. (in: a-proteobacteria)]HEV2512130.1 ABC transporter ATP-binding protein [Bosea sp. (in: a-proteobacteria)]